MRDAMVWVHDRTVDGMNAGTRRPHADARGHRARPPRRRRGLRQDELERASHLGELRRLVPPPLHHRALRRAHRRRRRRPRRRRRRRRARRRGAGAPRRRPTGRGAAPHRPRPRRRHRTTRPPPTVAVDASRSLLDASDELLGVGMAATLASTGWSPAGEPGQLRLRPARPCSSPAVRAGSATRSPRAFADAGASVTVTGTRAGRRRLRHRPRRASPTVRLRDDRRRVGRARWSRSLDALDVLVNNAGANFPGGRDEWEPDDLRHGDRRST